MTDQPSPQGDSLPSPPMAPDWQQIALLLLWKLLPAGQRSVTIRREDFADVMDSYHGQPVITFRPGPEATEIGLATVEEAQAQAAAHDASLPQPNAPASDALQ
jgi:hypothetical protein